MLIEPGDVNGLASAILRLLMDPELASRLGENGTRARCPAFSAEVMAKSYIGQYEQVLASRSNGTHKPAALEVSCR